MNSYSESMILPQLLISQYRAKIDGLRLAIENDDVERITELDREVSSKFVTIINTTPHSEKDKLELLEFLLEHLIQSGSESGIAGQIKSRILELAVMTFDAHAENFQQ